MLTRAKLLAASLLLAAPVALATGCDGTVHVGGSGGGGAGAERWTTTENTNVKLDWDKVNEAYRLADGPADFERRVNEIYEGDEIISIAVRDADDRTQVVTGFFDRDGNGRVSDDMIHAAMTAEAELAPAPTAAAEGAPTAAEGAPAAAAGEKLGTPPATAVAPPAAAEPPAAKPPTTIAAAAPPPATGAEREAIFTITRTVGSDGSAQVQTMGYGPYYGYHSPMLSIMSGMLMGSMMASMFSPRYVPVGMYATSASRASQLRNQRAGYRAQNPSRFTKPSKTGRAYGGKPSAPRSGAPARSRGGGRFGLHDTAGRRIAHLGPGPRTAP
ncbi:MAG: hypothetical protein R2939_22365 [Kofleriaceae bacterium]